MWRSLQSALPRFLVVGALISLVYFSRICILLLVNIHGPLSDMRQAALLVAFVAAALCAVLFYGVGRALLRAGPALAIGYLAATAVGAVVLAPTVCDTHESWVDTPNRRCTCQGWSFEYYPPGVFDGASSDYCVGLEQPVAATTP
jgi:hypothetical protein